MGHIFVFHLGTKYGFEMNELGHWFLFEYEIKDGDWKLRRSFLEVSNQDPYKSGSGSTVKY